MKFQKGNKFSRGGKKGNKGGRKSNQVKANEAEAIRLFREKLAESFGPLLDTALKVANGVKRRKCDARGVYYEIEYDTSMLRFLIDRFIPAARQAMDVAVGTPEEFYQAIAAAKRDETALVKKG